MWRAIRGWWSLICSLFLITKLQILLSSTAISLEPTRKTIVREREREREMNPFPYRSMLWAGSYEYVPNPVIDRCGSEQPTALIMSHWAQRAPLFTTREYWETLYYKRLFLFPLLDLPAITSWNPNLLFVFEEVWGEQKPQHSCHCCNWLPLSPPSKLSHRPCSWALEID